MIKCFYLNYKYFINYIIQCGRKFLIIEIDENFVLPVCYLGHPNLGAFIYCMIVCPKSIIL